MPEPAPVHPVSRVHLDELSDDTGVFQHANGRRPDPRHGYCTDDVARALSVDLLHARELGWVAVAPSVERGIRFLSAAFDPAAGRFRNFRRSDGSWVDGPGSEDAHARALLALGEAVAALPAGSLLDRVSGLFAAALPAALELTYIRPRAVALLACVSADGADAGTVGAAGRSIANALWVACEPARFDPDWPWPEHAATYENGVVPRALIVGGVALGRPRMLGLGLAMLDWLLEQQVDAAGHLSPVGNRGWWPRGRSPARFDQQPIEATSLLLAAAAAHDATGSDRYLQAMEAAYAWYLGTNDLGLPVAEPSRGAAFDGLGPAGVNANQGAESTLMWLTALEVIRRRRGSGVVPARGLVGAAR
ncbi:MAG: glycosyl transferase group 1 [Chloroflexi bacterium]|nr:glycosyl transferase group 1 [Chloroflexota bacterium]